METCPTCGRVDTRFVANALSRLAARLEQLEQDITASAVDLNLFGRDLDVAMKAAFATPQAVIDGPKLEARHKPKKPKKLVEVLDDYTDADRWPCREGCDTVFLSEKRRDRHENRGCV